MKIPLITMIHLTNSHTPTAKLFGNLAAVLLLSLVPATSVNGATYQGILSNIDADGDNAVDDLPIFRFGFDATVGATITFDSLVRDYNGLDWNNDGLYTGFDMYFRLYSASNVLLADVDDYSGPLNTNGSTHDYDSALQYTFPSAGSYYLAFGQLIFDDAQVALGYQRDLLFIDYEAVDGRQNFAPWQLDVHVSNGSISNALINGGSAVPEPAAPLFAALGVLSILRRRRVR